MSWLSLETYAEERDTWTPSYRARVDGYMNAARVRVRLSDGAEAIAEWDHEDKRWLDQDREPLDDVTHVWLGPAQRTSGPSGQHRNHRKFVGLSPEAWELVEQAMRVDRDAWPDWVRTALAEAVADRLGLDVLETVALFEWE